ncbi:MAG: sel1 repeat family protein [Pseudomonadota bacterium]
MRVATPFDTSLVRHWACALSALALLGLAGCQTTGAEDTVRICDSSGCFDAPRDYATFDPAANAPDDDPNGILGGLIIEAEADPAAAFDLGRRYLEGDGIRENPWEGIKWLRDAGQRGDRNAQAALGRIYYGGYQETGADWNEAERWLSLAAARGDRRSADLLDEIQASKAELAAIDQARARDIEYARRLRAVRGYTHPVIYDIFAYRYW